MGYRFDTPHRFVCRTYTGTQRALLKLFEAMPFDCTVRVKIEPSTSRTEDKSFESEGAFVEIEFSALYLRQWESPTREWLVQFIKEPPSVERVDCALFDLEPTDDDALVFGIENWRKVMANDEDFEEDARKDEYHEQLRRDSIAMQNKLAEESAARRAAMGMPGGLSVVEQLKWHANAMRARQEAA